MAKNLFATAVAMADTKKNGNKERVRVGGLERLAELKVAIETLKGEHDLLDNEIKTGIMRDHFISEGMRLHKRPDNFRGVEGNAEASLELRMRGGNSPLKPVEVDLAEQHGLPIETKTVYQLNPNHADNAELMKAINEAIVKHVKNVPDDLWVSSTKHIATAETVDAVFRLEGDGNMKPETAIALAMPLATVMAIKPKLNTMPDRATLFGHVLKPDLVVAPVPTETNKPTRRRS